MPNSAPAGSSLTRTVPRSYALHKSDFGFSDGDGNAFKAVVVTTLPGIGTLYYDANGTLGGGPTAVVAGQTISAADILAGKLTFVAPVGASGANYDHFTFQVQDDGGTAGGGIDTDPSPDTLTFDLVASAATPTVFGSLIDLTGLTAADGFRIRGDLDQDYAGWSVSSAGDVNGDGFDDVIVGARGNGSGGTFAGAAYVIFGKASGFGTASQFGPLIDLTGLSAADGFKIQGDASGDQAGTSVSSAGDINGDGFDDLIVGASGNDSGGTNAGAAYVIFGKASGFGTLIDLTGLPAATGFRIQGDVANDNAGRSVASAGDVNGDGFADILVGATGNSSGGTNAGAAYVIFGKAGGFGSLIDLTGLSASDGFKIQGDVAGDGAGRSVSSVGDINGDGFADILVGATGNGSSGTNAGAAYVIFGKSGGFGTLIDLTGISASDGFKIQGDAANDRAGISVSGVGDVNGDGFADIIVGAYQNDSGGTDAGAAYVIFGKSGGFGSLIDLTGLTAADGFKIQGDLAADGAGISVSSAGDVNGDGFADIIVGADRNDSGGTDAGGAYVVFGKAGGFGTLIDLDGLSADEGFKIQGDLANDRAGHSVSAAGDVNGDGYDDIIVGAWGNDRGGIDAGAAYVIFGRGNTAPTEAANTGLTMHRGASATITAARLDYDDAEQSDAAITYTITSVTNGIVKLGGTTLGPAGTFTQEDIDNGRVSYVHDGSATSSGAFGFSVSDGVGGAVTGQSFAFTVNPFNEAPSGADGALTVPSSFTLRPGDFGYSDDDSNAFKAVLIATLPGAGALYYDSNGSLGGGRVAVTAGQSISAADIAAGHLVFVAAPGASGAAYASFTFQVQDDGGIANGGTDLDPTPNSLSFDVLATYEPATSFPAKIDLAALGGEGFKIQGDAPSDLLGVSVSNAGDINGDGFADMIVGAPFNDDGGTSGGAAYVIFGHANGFETIDLGTALDPSQGFQVIGDAAGDTLGFSVSGAGDFNGDGFADIIIGADGNDADGADAGAAYVIFGHANGFGTIDLTTPLDPSHGFKIVGDALADYAGESVSGAGDVNGDGFADIIVGARYNDDGGSGAGAAYVIFGTAGGLGTIDLSTPLSSGRGFKILGGSGQNAGSSVSAAGDVNGDGFADIIVSARSSAAGNAQGAAYVIFGHASGFDTVDLGTPLDPGQGFRIQGSGTGGILGEGAGDVNGDGFADIVISNAGNSAYVIFGHASGFGTINLSVPLTASQGFKIQGGATGYSGFSVSAAGDVNGDGFADVIVGARYDTSGGASAGAAYVIFGRASGFGTIDLGTSLTERQGFKIQGELGSEAGTSVSAAGDVNGDGVDDLVVGADFDNGGGTRAGAAYLIFGRVDHPPVIDLNGAGSGIDNAASYTENAASSILAGSLTVGDIDDANIESASVQITGGFLASFDHLTVNGLASGTLSGISFSYGATTGILSLTGSATLADYEAVLRQVSFDSTSEAPGTSRTISWTVDDGAASSATASTTIAVTEVNDAPSGADKTITLLEDSGTHVLTVADFGFSDVDGNNFTFFLLNGVPSSGTLFFDPDGSGPQVAAPAFSGQFIQAFQVANGQLFYVPAANGNGTPYADFNFQVFDDGGTANGGSNFDPTSNHITFNVTPVNDAPVVDLNGAAAGTSTTLSYTENAPATAIAAGATVIDIDTTNYNGGHLLVQMTNGLNAEDVLSIINQGNGAGQIGYVSGVISYQGAPIADLLPASMSPFPTLDIAFRSGTVAPAAIEALVRAIGYTNLSDNPTTIPDRTLSFTLRDGDGTANGGADTGIATATISVTAVDDPAIARNDAVATSEATILGGNVLNNNGSGADSDVDGGPAFNVTAVNGNTAAVGHQIMLTSGALLTLNANGTFAYDPNHAFDATPAAGSGASNTPAHDSFTYTLTGGNTATVTVTIGGLDSNDVLLGTAGADVLNGGAGADTMSGGLGNDTYYVDNTGDSVVEHVGEGNDRVVASVSFTLAAGQEIETLTTADQAGTTALNLTGNEFAQTLIGNAGANILSGGGGGDYLIGLGGDDVLIGNAATPSALQGGTGNDCYYVFQTGDSITEFAGEGNDRIITTVSYTLSGGQEIETLMTADQAGTAAIDLTGNALAQVIIGNAGANLLSGGGGGDYLIGLGGDDVLVGNAAAPSALQGGTGNDWYYVFQTGDSITEFAGEGNDRIITTVSYTLSAGVEVETLAAADQAGTSAIDLTGNALAQVIIGNAGANLLSSGGGGDYLIGLGGDDVLVGNAATPSALQGGTGNDWYYVFQTGDSITEFAGEGNDRITTTVSYTLSAGVEVETLAASDQSGTAAIDLVGNDFGQLILGTNGVNVLSGNGGADQIVGLGGDDVLLGGDGDDQLNGGAGNDVLNGGAGADLFVLADALGASNVDTIQDFAPGADRIALDHNIFTGLSTGVLSAGAFVTGTAAQDADDRIIYDAATGNVYFDADGNGAGAAMLFATLANHPTVTASDFVAI
jgi:VCBS repeat-containing protein